MIYGQSKTEVIHLPSLSLGPHLGSLLLEHKRAWRSHEREMEMRNRETRMASHLARARDKWRC